MGTLRHNRSGKEVRLRANHSVGRSIDNVLVLQPLVVSCSHAGIRWRQGWEIRDLGSTNGTWLNGERCVSRDSYSLKTGDELTFGVEDDAWTLIDESPPTVMAQRFDGAVEVWAEGVILALPSDNDPQLSVFQDRHGEWLLERDGETESAHDGQVLDIQSERWRLHLPEHVPETQGGGTTSALSAAITVALRFTVSADRRDVKLDLVNGDGRVDLGTRAHHELLLVLARKRLEDRERGGVNRIEEGWLEIDGLSRRTGLSIPTLNIQVHRARRQFESAGVVGATDIVERRTVSRQIRIGVDQLEVVEGFKR